MSTKEKKNRKETPLMQQYYAIKAKHPTALLLFRVGDFYETFGEDAIKASNILGIVLTQRKNGAASHVELAGFPHHSLDTYLPKLVRAGQRVAICDQLEDPKMTKTIVKRGVTELVTPGVSFNEQILDKDTNNFLAAVAFGKSKVGASFLDISTGEFFVATGNVAYIQKLMAGFKPSEILYDRSKKKQFTSAIGAGTHDFAMDEWVFQEEYAREQLNRQFKTISLKGFGIDDQLESIIAAGAALQYLGETQHHRLEHVRSISRIDSDDHVWLDQFTQRNLEIFRTNNLGGKALLDVINNCLTPMGSRLLRQWLAFPLNKVADVNARLETVSAFVESAELLEELRSHLRKIGDLERMASRLSIGKLHPKEAISLSKSLGELEPIKESLKKNKKFDHSISKFADTSSLIQLINRTVQSDPPALASKGGVIANGINEDLDDLRIIAYSGKDHLVKIQQEESERTGISSLKIGYNNVFGYYLEVTNTHKDKVPEEWIRKQTLTNAERYITEELKEYEQQILGAEEKIQQIEIELYDGFLQELAHGIPEIQQCARAIAELDCLGTFAFNARAFDYCRPILSNGSNLLIKEGRHAVIEREMPHDETYIPNDILLNKDEQQLIMLTGPNMSGKSALLRQTAIIVLMAQIGSYVAATEAEIGIVDKIFTRVGASDNISQGESTFMVEMNETASILNNLSDKSLILLDEIGRGTSTYDGISIAWAIAEYLHQHEGRPLTLFATHYHELNEMTDRFERIRNFTISIREAKDKIIFLRKLIEGGSEHSFGIHVATMAGMPSVLIKRAEEVLKTLEGSDRKDLNSESLKDVSDAVQMSIFQLDDPVLSQIKEEIQNIEIDSLTPVEALFKLNEIKKLLGSK